MALTEIDPGTALIVVDLQRGLASAPCVHPVADVTRKAAALAAAFRRRGLPVVLVNTTGTPPGRTALEHPRGPFPTDFAALMPELDPQPDDHRVTKRSWGAFTGTDLQARLAAAGTTQVVVCGIATSLGVESTARQAHELGFNVALAGDAMTDISAEAHANSLELIFPRLGEVGTAREIIDLVARR